MHVFVRKEIYCSNYAENVRRDTLQNLVAWIPRIQAVSTCMKGNLPATEEVPVVSGSVMVSFAMLIFQGFQS
jgi:hypothetical protein